MQRIENPQLMTLRILGLIAAIAAVTTLFGLIMSGDGGFIMTLLGAIFLGIILILIPIFWLTGKKQVKEIEALISGQDLLAHWTYDEQEWHRYTENEQARGMKQAMKYSAWTFGIALVLLLGIGFLAGITAGYVLIALCISLGLTALIGGTLVLSTKTTYALNQARLGEVYIGPTAVYFGNRYYSWARWSTLNRVAFEPGEPSVVQFDYTTGSGESQSSIEVRVPVPRGKEGEAENLVQHFYAAS